MSDYRERMWPSPWIWVASLLLIPASMLVLAPVSLPAGIVTGIVLYAGALGALSLTAPVIEVADGRLRAGRAEIDLAHTGSPVAVADAEATRAELGLRLDARAFLVIRGWIKSLVRIPITDAADPTPYWLVSTRRPDELAAAIDRSRRPDAEPTE
ncbi:DUF3093 domain-containing protein [Agromyces sp. LHK192]|uniref:DUF3093 domain-containing protein n=1 Tax=Agromyces sp. LHK192 TaxID=2498704 RepID=UPI000FD8CEB0|nr:DUF3093 domain-containing protein [Agromyces sp. LHK192]